MDHEHIKFATLSVFNNCKIRSFPIQCLDILHHYNLDVYPYNSLSKELHDYCISYSHDSLNYKDIICYNDQQPEGRIRFSLMHELGHVILKHKQNTGSEDEQAANLFASHILAPRMAIHYAKCKNEVDVSKLFGLTLEASQYAFHDYRRWYRHIVYHKMNSFDKAMYLHFYNEEQDKFIYKTKQCVFCGTIIYNSSDLTCKKCEIPRYRYLPKNAYEPELLIAENQWLYGNI